MTIKELKELRASKETAMSSLVEERKESMDNDTLSAIKDFKSEIEGIDNQISAIEEVRSIAVKNSAPKSEKVENAMEELRSLHNSFLRTDISTKEFQKRAMGISAGLGGETIPEGFYSTLFEATKEYGVFFQDTNIMKTDGGNPIKVSAIDDTANEASDVSEGGTISGGDATTSEIYLNAYKIGTSVEVSTELLEDSYFDIGGYIAKAIGVRIGRKNEKLVVKGTGVNQALGVINDPKTVNYTSIDIAEVTIEDLRKMKYSLSPIQRKNAIYYVSDKVIESLEGQVDANGRPLLQESASSTQANGVEYRIFGHPVKVNYEVDQDIVTGNVPVFFGNPKAYTTRIARDVEVSRSDDAKFLEDMVVYKGTMRLDGKIIEANNSFVKLTVQ